MTIGELIVNLGFNSDNRNLLSFIHDIGELNLSSVLAAGALGGIVETVKNIMETADKATIAFRNMSAVTGVSAVTFQGWDEAAQQFGVSAGATTQQISQLQSAINQLIATGDGPGQQIGRLLGVDPRQFSSNPQDLLKKELDYLEQFDPATRRFYAQLLGVSDEMLLLVGHTQDLDKQLVNTKDQFKAIGDIHKELTRLSTEFLVVIDQIAAILGPLLKPLFDGLGLIFETGSKLLNMFQGWIQPILILTSLLLPIANIFKAIGIGVSLLGFLNEKFNLSAQLIPQQNGGGSPDNSRTIQMRNEYNIQGGNGKDIADQINGIHQKNLRDADLMNYQPNY